MAPNIALQEWIKAAGITNAEAARRCAYDRSNFHRIIAGDAKPTIELADRIARMTDGEVPLVSWIGFEPSRPTEKQVAA